MKIIALGSPGAGKGTYAVEIVKKYGIPHISTGDIFREQIKLGTEVGKRVAELLSNGQLVPDEITNKIMEERLSKEDCGKGFFLDGFPRTIPQAEALSRMVKIDMVINFKADGKIIINRLSGRRICRKCGAIFHIRYILPKIEGVCDKCGGELYQRDDDNPESIKERLKVYEEQTASLIDYYKKRGLLREITINEEFREHQEEIMERIFKLIEG